MMLGHLVFQLLCLILSKHLAHGTSHNGINEGAEEFGTLANKNLDILDYGRLPLLEVNGIDDLIHKNLLQNSVSADENIRSQPMYEYDENVKSSNMADLKDPRPTYFDNNNAARDEEHIIQNGLWGHQYMQGGAGEGNQFLNPDGFYKNIQEIKTDAYLPTYCDPPNPCPVGYSEEDGCLEGVKNTADFSREYQSQQECICDPEHMFDCPAEPNPILITNDILNALGNEIPPEMSSIFKGIQPTHIAKKGFQTYPRSHVFQKKLNPNLMGKKLRTVAKKGKNIY